jgi:energy-coupling factor transporter ATP-binding protein EcfA2
LQQLLKRGRDTMTLSRREQIAAYEEELHTLWRRAHRLQLYVAQYGSAAEPGRILELEDVEAQHMQLQQTITQLRNVTPDAQVPYLGLKTFDEANARFFYGREALIDTLVERVKHTAFLTVIGPSGSGKSSVVRAGLIPALKQGLDIAGSDEWIYVPPFPPGPRPMNALAAVLAALPEGGRIGTALAIENRLKLPDGLLFCADQLLAGRSGARVVLVIDQAEELWSLAPNDRAAQETHRRDQQQPFIAQLLSATQAADRQVLVVLTLRADFMGRVAAETRLAAFVEQNLQIITLMEPPDLRRAIELPAEVAGGTFQPGLVDELIDQIAGEPGALPLLEYTLESLWAAKQSDGALTWEAYRAIGGVEGALTQGADHVLDSDYAEPKQRDAIREVLLRLVQPGDGLTDSRRRVPLKDLVPAGSTVEIVQALITPLVNARLLTTGREADTAQDTVEVTHEALIRSWPTLRDWIAVAKADLRLQRQLEDAAREWEAGQRSSDLLWQGARLAQAEAWVAHAHPLLLTREQQFLTASRAAEMARRQAERRRIRSIIAGLIVALVLITGFASGTVWFWQTAERNGHVSQARFLIAEGQRLYDEQPLLGLRLMAEGLASVPQDETTIEHDLAAAVIGYVRQGRVGVLAQDATNILAGSLDAAPMLIIVRRGQPGVVVWGERMQETVLPSPLATDSLERPAVVISPKGELGVLIYAEGKGGALLRADGTVVPLPSPLATARYGQPSVAFSPQGQLGVLNYAERNGAALLHADGAVVPLPSPLATDSDGQPSVAFSPQGQLVAVAYAEGKGTALLHADGTVVSLPSPLATTIYGQPAVVFSPQGQLVAVAYAEGKGAVLLHADGTVVPLPSPLATTIYGQPAVVFSPKGELGVLNYADGKGAVLLHADGMVDPLPSPFAIDSKGQPAVVFSPKGELGVLNYAEGKGGALLHADGTVVPLPSPLATDSDGQPVVVFSPQGELVAVAYAEGKGAALLHTDGTVVPLARPLATTIYGQPAVVFSPQGQLVVVAYANVKGAALLHADGTVVPLARPLATDAFWQPAVVFSPKGELAVLNYVEGKGAALLHADGTVVPLPNPLATDNKGQPVVVFSNNNRLIDLEYVTGYHELRTLSDSTQFINLRSNVDSVVFMANSSRVVVSYRDGHVYVVDPQLPPGVNDASNTLSAKDLISFICDGPLKTGFWTPQDDADLREVLQGAAPQAGGTSRP